jgi:AraC-like DNA-binding protein
MARIMMQLRDTVRPLSFAAARGAPPSEFASASWSGLDFEVHHLRSACDVGESGPIDGELGLMVITRGAYDATLRGATGDVQRHSPAGTLVLLSGDDRPYVHAIRGDAEVVAIKPAARWLAYLPVDPVNVRPGARAGGSTLLSLVRAMRSEVANGCPSGRIFAESLSVALLSHVFHLFPSAGSSLEAGLCPAEQQRLTRYIHDHLDRDLGLTNLANVVGMTVRELSTRFRKAFGVTPHRYVMRARLHEGARLLEAGRYDIAEVALRTGFSSQSHFTTAFAAAYGAPPKRYARARARALPSI